MRAIILLFLATVSSAERTVQPCSSVEEILAQIKTTATNVSVVAQAGGDCAITYTPIAPVTFTDRMAERAAIRAEGDELVSRYDTLTIAECRRLLRLIWLWVTK